MSTIGLARMTGAGNAAGGGSPLNRIILLIVGVVILTGISFGLVLYGNQSGGQGEHFLPRATEHYNQRRVQTDPSARPGALEYSIVGLGGNGETVAREQPTDEELQGRQGMPPPDSDAARGGLVEYYTQQRAREGGGELPAALLGELRALDALPHGPLFDLSIALCADSMNAPDPNLNLKREYNHGERLRLPGADPRQGPFYQPYQQETPWIVFDDVVRKIAQTDPTAIRAVDNGNAYLSGVQPETIRHTRGRVFTVTGVLWSLKKQPLRISEREALRYGERTIDHAYYGVVARLRKGLPHEKHAWIHEAAAFTTLTLPDELARYASEPNAAPSNDDPLADGKVHVRLRGVYFRRIMYWEPAGVIAVERPIIRKGYQDAETINKLFWSEAYLPWLVSQEVEIVPATYPTLDEVREVVNDSKEDARIFTKEEDRNKFDEAGYYLLLRSLTDPASPLVALEPEELSFRKLREQKHRDAWRAARVRAAGLLQAEYFPLILPPNISGRRFLYRAFVTDALTPDAEDTLQQWYVDTLEAPLDFRGKARVRIDGYYYRSQIFQTSLGGETKLATFPLLLTPRITAYVSDEKPADIGLVVWVTVAVAGGVIVLLIALGAADKRSHEKFERETLGAVRSKLRATRGRREAGKKELRGSSQPPGEAKAPPLEAPSAPPPASGESEQRGEAP